TRFVQPLLTRLKSLPGVVDAAESSALPPYSYDEANVDVTGKTHLEQWPSSLQYVSEEYFRVLRIEFKQGRGFSESEVNNARKIAIVNETFVRKYLSNENPIGQHVRIASLEAAAEAVHDPTFQIIGVVGDVTNRGLQVSIAPEMWIPYTIAGAGI